MATAKGKTAGKSMFLKNYLADHPDAEAGAIAAAWREAGNAGTISSSLVSQVRKDLGLTGRGPAADKSRTTGRRLPRRPTSEAALRRGRTAGV